MDIESSVPNRVDFGSVLLEFDCGIDLDGGTIVNGGHFATIHGCSGREEVDVVKGVREKW